MYTYVLCFVDKTFMDIGQYNLTALWGLETRTCKLRWAAEKVLGVYKYQVGLSVEATKVCSMYAPTVTYAYLSHRQQGC